eukprot:gb/GECH01007424.1/.p1 GENE.gb/GECH01007424.1/~~gb/GECH01007424.1/.p1  ORF type:complete len:142 (+),score=27.89 gb/GECH01007424.1/:1-426(+)
MTAWTHSSDVGSLYLIIDTLFDRIKQQNEPKLSKENLIELHFLFENHLPDALNIVEKRQVVKITAKPSERSCWKVMGRSNRKYICLSNTYCSCPGFTYGHVKKQNSIYCKHLLAVRIADSIGIWESETVTDMELSQMLVEG